ncbi:MAG: hypothetical protein M9949_14385 [Candidatus Kapabacteria bacterium]|nr:hypothetical protein [Candidatus Kapabacteria bacterium]
MTTVAKSVYDGLMAGKSFFEVFASVTIEFDLRDSKEFQSVMNAWIDGHVDALTELTESVIGLKSIEEFAREYTKSIPELVKQINEEHIPDAPHSNHHRFVADCEGCKNAGREADEDMKYLNHFYMETR